MRLTDDDVFGPASAGGQRLTDDDIFGGAPDTGGGHLSDDDVFGQSPDTGAPAHAAEPPGMLARGARFGLERGIDTALTFGRYAEQARDFPSRFMQGFSGAYSSAMKGAPTLAQSAAMRHINLPRDLLADMPSPQDSPIYQAGQALEDFTRETFPTDPRFDDDLASETAGALGSFTGFMIPGGAAGIAARSMMRAQGYGLGMQRAGQQAAQFGTAAPTAATAGAEEAYARAMDFAQKNPEFGLTEADAVWLAPYGAAGGLVQIASLAPIFRFIPNEHKAQSMAYLLRRMAEAGVSEWTVENAGAVIQNLTEQTYNPDQETFEDVPDRGNPAGIAGALMQAILFPGIPTVSGRRTRSGAIPSREEVEDLWRRSGEPPADGDAVDVPPNDRVLPALPPPRFDVTPEGVAGRPQEIDAARAQAAQERESLGMTPDVEQAGLRHPGSPLTHRVMGWTEDGRPIMGTRAPDSSAGIPDPSTQSEAPAAPSPAGMTLPGSTEARTAQATPAEGEGVPADPTTPAARARMYEDLAAQATDPGVKNDLLRQAEIYRSESHGEPVKMTPRERARRTRIIDPSKDDLVTAIRRLGGIDTEIESDWVGRLSHLDDANREFGLPHIERPGKGRSLDDLAEALMGYGYLQEKDAGRLAEMLWDAEDGTKIFSMAVESRQLEREMESRMESLPDADEMADVTGRDEALSSYEEMAQDAPVEEIDGVQASGLLSMIEAEAEAVDSGAVEAILERAAIQGLSEAEIAAQLIEVIRRPSQDASEEHRGSPAEPSPRAQGPRGASAEIEPGIPPQTRSGSEITGTSETATPQESPLTLETQTEESLRERAEAERRREAEDAERRRQEEQRAQADRDRAGFTLTGSSRPADVAMSHGQRDLIGAAQQRRAGRMEARTAQASPVDGAGVPADQPRPSYQQDRSDNFKNFVDRAARRLAMEEQGQGILDDLSERGIHPQSVSQEFWSDTYPLLSERMQRRFSRYVTSLTGWEPGSVVAGRPDGSVETADSWQDIARVLGEDLGDVDNLQGTERGYVALMEWANQQRRNQRPDAEESTPSAQIESAARRPPPAEPESVSSSSDVGGARGDDVQPASDERTDKINDLGEKIGGARKDTAQSLGGRTGKESKPRSSWRDNYHVAEVVGGDGKGGWVIHHNNDRRGIVSKMPIVYPTKEAAEAAIPLAEVARRHRAGPVATAKGESQKYAIWRRISDRKHVIAVGQQFDSREDAMHYMAEHAEDIIDTKLSFGEEILPTPGTVYRSGVERRNGDVTGQDFMDTFGFRGVEFGNWNNQMERQEVMNHAYDALLDLAEVIRVPPQALSLNGDLALAFGARGQGLSGAKAHYETSYGAINLTKMKGAGSLAHEWLHAFDHYLARQDGSAPSEKVKNKRGDLVYDEGRGKPFASHGFLRDSKVREEVRAAYENLIRTMFDKAETYVEDSRKAEEFVGKARDVLAKKLDSIRQGLSRQLDTRYWKRNNKPASSEQLARFDELAEKLVNGESPALEVRRNVGSKSKIGSYRMSNDVLDEMGDIYKAVRGRSAFLSSGDGILDDMRGYIQNYRKRIDMLKDAAKETQKVRKIPTSFRMQAVAADQAKSDSYWSSPHEMAARAFAAYVEDKLQEKNFQNDFLAYHAHGAFAVPVYPEGFFRPYPEGNERKAVNAAFESLFDVIQTKETDRGVAMFSRRGRSTADRKESGDSDAGGLQSQEDSALYSGYERNPGDIRGQRRDSGRVSEPSPDGGRTGGQGELFTNLPADKSAARAQAADTFHVRYKQVEVDRVRTGVNKVRTAEDAAHVFAPFRKHGQETMLALAVDKDGTPLSIIRHSKLAKDGASVDLLTLVGAIAATENATGYWLAHNHPSGNLEPSEADLRLTKAVVESLEGVGLEHHGHVIVATGGKATVIQKRYRSPQSVVEVKVRPLPRTGSVPITERVIRKSPPAVMPALTSPDATKALLKDLSIRNGLLLLNTQHRVVGVVALDADEMAALREGGRARRILAATDAVNSSASVIVSDNKASAVNLARFLNRFKGGGMRVLDAMIYTEGHSEPYSSASFGDGIEDSTGVFFSRAASGAPGAGKKAIAESIVNSITAQWKNAPKVRVLGDMGDAPEAVRQADEQARSEGDVGEVEAFYYRGEVYIVLDGLEQRPGESFAEALFRVLAHEALGHAGLRGLFGADLTPILRQIAAFRRKDVAAKARKYGYAATIGDARDAVLREARESGKKIDPKALEAKARERLESDTLRAAEEVLAEMAESTPNVGFVRRAVEAIRQALRAMYMKLPAAAKKALGGTEFVKWLNGMSDAEIIRDFIIPARRFIQEGEARKAADAQAAPAFSFAGETADTADRMSLDAAQSRTADGEKSSVVRAETGWYKGADSKWRFEIDDSKARLRMPWPHKGQKFGDMYREIAGDPLRTFTVGEMVDHPALFAAYPGLRNVVVDTKSGLGAELVIPQSGAVAPQIRIGRDEMMTDVLSNLLHEMQHMIQQREGFASGGSPEQFVQQRSPDGQYHEVTNYLAVVERLSGERVEFEPSSMTTVDDGADWVDQWYEQLSAHMDKQLTKSDVTFLGYMGWHFDTQDAWHKVIEQMMDAARKEIDSSAKGPAPFEQYRRLAGEVEARNVQKRQRMSAEERRQTEPAATQDVPDSDVIVMFNGRRMENAPPPANVQGAQIDSDAFRRWFGDSKVVDANGRPLVVYHGTIADFGSFDNSKTGRNDNGLWGKGHYFTANPENASSYALRQGDGAQVVPAYVSIKRPLILKTGSDLVTRLPDGTDSMNLVGPMLDGAKIKEIALSGGHDGVIQLRPNGMIGDVVAFRPEQIKSAIGNNGDFDPANPDIRFSRRQTPKPDTEPSEAQQRQESFLKAILSQPIDRAFRAPFDVFGLVDSTGRFKGGTKVAEAVRKVLVDAKPAEGGRFAWMNPMLETARAGIVDRYRLSNEYKRLWGKRESEERAIVMKGIDTLKDLEAAGVDSAEAKVLQAILNGEVIPDAEWKKLSDPIRAAVDEMGQEAVMLGLISAETYERNKGSYLHRVYLKHESRDAGLGRWMRRALDRRRRAIIGNATKRRGIDQPVTMSQLQRHAPDEWWGRKMKEGAADKALANTEWLMLQRVEQAGEGVAPLPGLEEGGGPRRIKETIYWPADESLPARYETWENKGRFKVIDVRGNKAMLWRDYTKAERENMGEILDARYTIARTYQELGHDLATGRFFKDVAQNPEWSVEAPQPGDEVATPSEYSRMRMHVGVDWVKVPDVTIERSGAKKWGMLSGRYIRPEIWRDLNELDRMRTQGSWRKLLNQWKINKTARSPVVHLNNVMSNLVLMDLADVRATDLIEGLRSYVKGDQHYQDALEHGAFEGGYVLRELNKQVLDPLLEQIAKEAMAGNSIETTANVLSRMLYGLAAAVKKADRKMVEVYQIEDEVFRMATYMRRLALGDPPDVAAHIAKEQFLNYDIRAPWINALRGSVLPFISYTYRAVPVVAQSIAERPWKIAKYATLAYLANLLAYEIAPGDEDEERRTMRDQEQGYTWIGTPRMLRMPYRDDNGNPVFLDIRRWIPAGDIFDMQQGQSAIPIPAPLQFGGPMMLGAELFLNKQAFTGQQIINPNTDDAWDRTRNISSWAWKSWMPSAAWIPGSWYWDAIWRAAEGGRDPLGRPYSVAQAASSSVGVKLKPHDVQMGYRFRSMELQQQRRALQFELRRLEQDRERGLIKLDTYERERDRTVRKMERLKERADQLMTGGD